MHANIHILPIQLPERGLAALARFPIVLLAGVFLAWVIMLAADGGPAERLLLTALVAIVIAFDFTLLKERFGNGGVLGQVLVLVVTSGALALIWWSIDLVAADSYALPPYDKRIAADEPIRILAIAVALHSLAAVIPFLGRRIIDDFWDYNRRLFLRALSAALFSGVLFAGLAVALWAIDELLNVTVDGETYTDLFAVMAGVVCTWFFLAGVPVSRTASAVVADDGIAIDPAAQRVIGVAFAEPAIIAVAAQNDQPVVSDTTYPRGLKVFVQFVLLPLTIVYLVILYLYALRITFEWELPQGQVSYLIFSYAVVGILAYLLIYPLRDDDENQWIRRFGRGFFIALSPLLIILVVALARRIADYGLTESRYYGMALAGWLTLIVVYFLTRREDIRVIPATLAAVALITIVGPWGATAVAVRSQLNELKTLSTDILLNENKSRNMLSITHFLFERGRVADGARMRTARPDTVDSQQELAALFGVDPEWAGHGEQNLHITFRKWRILDLQGYSEVIDVADIQQKIRVTSASLGQVEISLIPPGVLRIDVTGALLDIRLDSIARALIHNNVSSMSMPQRKTPRGVADGLPAPEIETAAHGIRAQLVLNWIAGNQRSDSTATVNDISGTLLLGKLDEY